MEGQNGKPNFQGFSHPYKQYQDYSQPKKTSETHDPRGYQGNHQDERNLVNNFSKLHVDKEHYQSNNEVQKYPPKKDALYEKSYFLVNKTRDWEFVVENLKPALRRGRMEIGSVLKCILSFAKRFDYNPEKNRGNLKTYFSQLHPKQISELEEVVFPAMAQLILETPTLFPNKIPLLVQWENQKVQLSKEQCACLLSHMFMCTTLRQKGSQILPRTFNFSELFTKERDHTGHNIIKLEKLTCIMNYFRRVFTAQIRPTFVVFERLVLQNKIHGEHTLEAWRACSKELGKVEIIPRGKIEDAVGAIEIDFAAKSLGGGVVRNGNTQEEVQFITSPELIVGLLFCEFIDDNEAISMQGTEIFSNYKGYKGSFRFDSDYKDMHTPVKNDILDREIIAIDAMNFAHPDARPRFAFKSMLRELNKAYVGFYGSENKSSKDKPIATGKWGCGVFKGNLQFKFLLQWIACSRARRNMLFYPFGDSRLEGVELILSGYKGKKVGEIVEDVLLCCEHINSSNGQEPNLFGMLLELRSLGK